jgi:hypothetical protein
VAQEVSAEAQRSTARAATVPAQHEQRAEPGAIAVSAQVAQPRETAETASRTVDGKRPAQVGQSEKGSVAAHGGSAPDAAPSSDAAARVLGPYGC